MVVNAEPLRIANDDVELLDQLSSGKTALLDQVSRRIVGQKEVLEGVMTAILSGGHALLVGVPGLAKTLMVSTIAEALALKPEQWVISFQSRFGRAEWLKPYTADVLAAFGRQHIGRVDVACPGFVSDCLETLEEIAIEGKTVFLQAGGRDFHYIPCLNERHDWIHTLTEVVANELQGWLNEAPAESLDAARMRALALGAKA